MYYNNRGNVYRAAEKLPEAIADFSKSIELAPQDVTGYFERGQTEVMLARKETDQKSNPSNTPPALPTWIKRSH